MRSSSSWRHDERRGHRDEIADAAHDHALFARQVVRGEAERVRGGVRVGAARRALQLERADQAEAARLGHHRVAGELAQRRLEARADVVAHALDQALALDHVEVRERRRAGRRVTGVGEAVREIAAGLDRRGDLVAHDGGAERQVTARDALRHRHQIRIEIPETRREPGAEAAEAGDHLVGDEQDLVAAAQLAQIPQVAVGRHDHAAGPLHRLGEEAPRSSRRPRARSCARSPPDTRRRTPAGSSRCRTRADPAPARIPAAAGRRDRCSSAGP